MIAGIVVAGFGLASVYIAPLSNYLIATFGLSQSMLVFGIAFLVVVCSLSVFLVNPPVGFLPEGTSPAQVIARAADDSNEYSPLEMLRTGTFYKLWLMYFIGAGAALIIIGGVAVLVLSSEIDQAPNLVRLDISQILSFVGMVAFKICLYACLVLAVMAALDYAFQRWQHEEKLKMTKQEVKDEARQREGDPKVKARIRSVQIEMARRRMMEAVPGATVVVTNPTHLAVALKFEAAAMVAPQVVAKGAGHVAARIKELAKAHGVPVIEQKPLAQALFKAVEIGDFIPSNLYRAVAEILAYVYRLKRITN